MLPHVSIRSTSSTRTNRHMGPCVAGEKVHEAALEQRARPLNYVAQSMYALVCIHPYESQDR